MGVYSTKSAKKQYIALGIAMLVLLCAPVFAQKTDSARTQVKPKTRIVTGIPQINANVPTYRPYFYNYYPTTNNILKLKEKGGKTLTVLKIYPNPVEEQLNISFRLEAETTLSIKITDLLGNEIVTLANGRAPYGEQTRTFTMPTKLNSGIYFLRIVAGGEPIIKRISVL